MLTAPRSRQLTPDQLTSIRQNTNWRQLFAALQIEKDPKKSKDHDWWGKSPLRPTEHTPSFHMNVKGWYCHSTSQGGGPLELLQRIHEGMNCYQAGKWLLERGLSHISTEVREDLEAVEQSAVGEKVPAAANPPIRQDLRAQLIPGHSGFSERGVPDSVCCDLGAGYLDRSVRKSRKADPLNQRLVFQIRGLQEDEAGDFKPIVLGHIGRATSEEQIQSHGKWWTYPGFRKSLELYNQDLVLLRDTARAQAQEMGHLLLVEGCFDVAKLWAAGIENAVACFGSKLSLEQVERLWFLAMQLGIDRVHACFDRDAAGEEGTKEAFQSLSSAGLAATAFNWQRTWTTPERRDVPIPDSIGDPADFSVGQLQWLRGEGLL